MKNALISVSDKRGIVDFARALVELGRNIISTGGTFRTLSDYGVPVLEVSDYTGFPEMMNGRLKTLHPKIHGGLLGVLTNPEHAAKMREHNIEPIDLVVVNLYPFEQTIRKEGVRREEAIEQIDIGGPAMLRSAAKNHERVTPVVDPNDYALVLKELRQTGGVSQKTREMLAAKVFDHTSRYDDAIAKYLTK